VVPCTDGKIPGPVNEKAVFPFIKTRDIKAVRNNDTRVYIKNEVIDSDTGFRRCL
jgi:hypothetical protein